MDRHTEQTYPISMVFCKTEKRSVVPKTALYATEQMHQAAIVGFEHAACIAVLHLRFCCFYSAPQAATNNKQSCLVRGLSHIKIRSSHVAQSTDRCKLTDSSTEHVMSSPSNRVLYLMTEAGSPEVHSCMQHVVSHHCASFSDKAAKDSWDNINSIERQLHSALHIQTLACMTQHDMTLQTMYQVPRCEQLYRPAFIDSCFTRHGSKQMLHGMWSDRHHLQPHVTVHACTR